MTLKETIDKLPLGESETKSEDIRSFKRAYQYCIWLLSKRDYSRYKLSQKLYEKKYTPFIDQLLDFLEEAKYLQEEQYIRTRIKTFMYKGLSKRNILNKLRSERVEPSTELIDELFDEYRYTENGQLRDLINKKLRSKGVSALEDFNFKQKLIRFLLSKGHSYDKINTELKNVQNDEESNAQNSPF
ncbi:regulatory protein RecX [Bacteriovorax sp. BAL6_X]|uniref:regulatory protein RecX n=1 Tax=Bacteriovorax sp. BAL6_X TaxID=1201290 RepID=UPI0003863A95|nr:regulatory protein RecX [Bacteriovorax sp. BAL6_X]EPZ50300.1 regulatory protein RecX [Bacteriovorax sp. BAL6_X]